MRRPALVITFLLALALLAGCAGSKAAVDYTFTEGIVWPGVPEKPRIKYLWSLQMISGAEGTGRFIRFIAGDVDFDLADPQYADNLINPQGVFFADGVVYIADPGARRVSIVDMQSMESFNIRDAGSFELKTPVGVAVDLGGDIYVSDADLKKVAVFNSKGKFKRFFKGEFKRPTGIAINPATKLLYVVDTWEHVVYVYGQDGVRRKSIGKRGEAPGEFNFPTNVAVDNDGLVYVSDTLNFRVQVFHPGGSLKNTFGLLGDTMHTFDKIKGIAVDTKGHIYVVDSVQDMVKIFSKTGKLLLTFGRKGQYYGEFYQPTGIYIDSTNRIFVTDSLNMRMQVFKLIGEDG